VLFIRVYLVRVIYSGVSGPCNLFGCIWPCNLFGYIWSV